MGLVDDIKEQAKKSGTNKGKFLYFKAGVKIRIRFLSDMDDGFKIKFHDSFTDGINVPCQEIFDRACPYCDDDDVRTRDQYAWPVWDYDAKEVKLLMAPVNQCSPIPGLVGMYEAYGTLCDRDYVITKSGSGQGTTYSVVPMDKAKFRNDKAKPLSEKKFYELLDKAFPCDGEDEEDDNKKKKKKTSSKSKKKHHEEDEDDDNDDEQDDDNEDEEMDYGTMDVKELYKECKKRDIDVEPKKKKSYYINLLEDDDNKKEDGWDDDDEEDGDDGDDW